MRTLERNGLCIVQLDGGKKIEKLVRWHGLTKWSQTLQKGESGLGSIWKIWELVQSFHSHGRGNDSVLKAWPILMPHMRNHRKKTNLSKRSGKPLPLFLELSHYFSDFFPPDLTVPPNPSSHSSPLCVTSVLSQTFLPLAIPICHWYNSVGIILTSWWVFVSLEPDAQLTNTSIA